MNLGHRIVGATALFASVALGPALAAPLSTVASDNATVQPGGPRAAPNGKAFFNVEGSANGSFASYGVADFSYGVLPFAVLGINSAQLELTQSNAGFSTTGLLVLSLDMSGTLADIQSGTSPLAFDGADPGTATDVGDGDLSLLGFGGGPFMYTLGTSGDVDVHSLTLDPVTEAEMVNRLNTAAPIRIVVGTGEAGVAATWAGSTNSTYAGPTLVLDVTYDTGVPTRAQSWGRIKALYR